MWKTVLSFFSPPVFPDDEDKTRSARYTNAIAWAFILIITGYQFAYIRNIEGFGLGEQLLWGLVILLLATRQLLKAGFARPASVILLVVIWASTNGLAYLGFGVRDAAFIANFVTITIAGLILGWQAGIAVAAFSALAGLGLAYAENTGLITPSPYPIMYIALDLTPVFIISAVTTYLLITSKDEAARRARENAKALQGKNLELTESQSRLTEQSQRLIQNQQDLETARQTAERRAAQFRSIAEVGRAVSTLQNLGTLLSRVTELIHQQFGFYHVGIFLVDNNQEYAVLSAANSEGGKRMLARGHMLRIGETGIVGYVAGYGTPRIALDTGADPVFFNNPDLPDTRSEMALPLKVGTRIIGALDVQSTEAAAFTEEDAESLSILADQVSLAIENARLLETTQRSLAEARTLYQQYSKDEWRRAVRDETLIGFRYSAEGITPLDTAIETDGTRKAAETGETILQETDQKGALPQIAVPIKLRGEVVGVINIRLPGQRDWSEDDVDIAEAVAERLALSIENARLFQATTERAERERVISSIAAKISGSARMENILRTTAQELSNALNGSEVLIQLQTGKEIGESA
ncbi:MAG: GAF domain-containing protein [Chloroflexota bacterium]